MLDQHLPALALHVVHHPPHPVVLASAAAQSHRENDGEDEGEKPADPRGRRGRHDPSSARKPRLQPAEIAAVDPLRAAIQVAGGLEMIEEVSQGTLAVMANQVVDERIGRQVRGLGLIRTQMSEARRGELCQGRQAGGSAHPQQVVVLGSAEAALAQGPGFDPLGRALVQPGGVDVGGCMGVEGGVDELVVQHAVEPTLHADVAADADHAVVEAGCGEAEAAGELGVEGGGVVDDDVDLAAGSQPEVVVDQLVGALEQVQHLLLEAARAVESPGLVDGDVLEEHEVRGFPAVEVPVRTAVSDGEGRHSEPQRQHQGGETQRVAPSPTAASPTPSDGGSPSRGDRRRPGRRRESGPRRRLRAPRAARDA